MVGVTCTVGTVKMFIFFTNVKADSEVECSHRVNMEKEEKADVVIFIGSLPFSVGDLGALANNIIYNILRLYSTEHW